MSTLIKPITLIIAIYSLVTCLVVWVAFTAGVDLGYSRGLNDDAVSSYSSGVLDGFNKCFEHIGSEVDNSTVIRKNNNTKQWL